MCVCMHVWEYFRELFYFGIYINWKGLICFCRLEMNVRPCCDEHFVYLSITTHIPVLPERPGIQCHTLVSSVSTNPHLPFKTRPIQIGLTRVWQCWILVCVYGIGVYSVYVWLICLAALIYALNFNLEITLTSTTKMFSDVYEQLDWKICHVINISYLLYMLHIQ